jgi:glycosyltransferase involved in cell wall biosynthesis
MLNTISVITPCLNIIKDGRLEYFQKMMKSIHLQKGVQIEHIVIDGKSSDGTLEILEEYVKSGWITKLISEKDNGIYSAMNKGLKFAKGDYVQIMNTDDYFTDLNYFKRSVKILRKDKHEKVGFFRMPFRHQTMIVKRNVFQETGFFDEKHKIASDYKWVLNLLLIGKKGKHISSNVLCSLDGGASSNREKCIKEVSKVLYDSYGRKYHLTLNDCRQIYERKISKELYAKILTNIKDARILESLKNITK